MASWPTSVKSFSPVVNGVTKLVAALFNVAYDEIEAIETSLVGKILTAGTPCVQNPWAATTVTTQAHGLGAIPDMVVAYYECITAELGYVAGDRINMQIFTTSNVSGATVQYDATNVIMITGGNAPYAIDKATPANGSVALAAAKWKGVVVPYKLA
jgi:hypothetical protein